MRTFTAAIVLSLSLGGCAKWFIPQECREVPAKDGYTYRFCESAASLTIERLVPPDQEAGASPRPPRLLDDPQALEILRRDAFPEK